MFKILTVCLLIYVVTACSNCNEVKEYYPNGKLEVWYTKCNGVSQGLYISYFPNGKIENEGILENGKPEGVAKYHYRNGSVSATGHFENGIKHGYMISYDSASGKIHKEGKYNHGKFTGIEYFFDKDGKAYASNIYKADTLDCFGNYKETVPTFWKQSYFNEDYWIDAQFDTTSRFISEKEFSFAVNHTIADSIRLLNNNKLIFKWPEDNSTSYRIYLPAYKSKEFKAIFYMRADLGNKEYAGKVFTYIFKLPIE